MKAKYAILLFSMIVVLIFGALLIAQEKEEDTTTAETTTDEAVAEDEATEGEDEAVAEDEATEGEDEAVAEDEATKTESLSVGKGFIKARLVCVNNANSYTIIINEDTEEEEEVVVALLGCDFGESDFYIFNKEHYQYAEWLLFDYQLVWVDYDPERTTAKGTPLVYFHYGPFETELWEDSNNVGDADTQMYNVVPPKKDFWGDPIEVYDHTVAEPFIDDPEFSTVFRNWYLGGDDDKFNPRKHGKEYIETYTDKNGKERTRKWYLRNLNRLMLLMGFCDVDNTMEYDKKAEFVKYAARAKWCRRGMWTILLPPKSENEEICGIKSEN